MLCPRALPKLTRPIRNRPKVVPDFDFLQALKTTEGYKWAHILCSIFVPDITFADASRLKVAEGIMSIGQQPRFSSVRPALPSCRRNEADLLVFTDLQHMP